MIARGIPMLAVLAALLGAGAAPATAADRGRLVLVATSADETRRLITIRPDGEGRRVIRECAAVECPITGVDASPDGRRLAITWGGDAFAIVRSDGSRWRELAPRLQLGRLAEPRYESPAWSPNGRRIGFIAPEESPEDGNERGTDVYTVRTDGRSLHVLTERVKADDLTWSSRGELAYVNKDLPRRRGSRYYFVNRITAIDGRGERRRTLAEGETIFNPEWSPAGDRLLYQTLDDIRVVGADRRGRRTLIANAGSPTWSPDGRKIAFQRPPHGLDPRRWFVARADGRGVRSLPIALPAEWGDWRVVEWLPR